MKRKRLASVAIGFTFLGVCAHAQTQTPAPASGITLRYGWTKGDVLKYRMSLQSDTKMTGMPGAEPASVGQTMTQQISLTVADVDAFGKATLTETVTAIRTEINGPMGRMVFDSASPAPSSTDPMSTAMAKSFSALIGAPVTIVIAADGAVQKVEGASRIVQKIVAGMGSDAAAGPVEQILGSMFSDEALRSMTEQSFTHFAPQPVKVGGTWNGRIALGNQAVGKVAGALTFTLKSVEGTGNAARAAIGVAMVLTQTTPPPPGPMNMTLKLGDSRGDGEVLFDLGRGRIVKSTMVAGMTSTVNMTGRDGAPVTVNSNVKSTVTLELVDR
jgi:hypothetical protein